MMNKYIIKGERGFTLIEMIIVVAIIGIVSAVAVLNVTGFSGKGKQECFNADRSALQEAVLAYRNDTGYCPTAGGASGNLVWTGAIDLNSDGDTTDTHGTVSETDAGLFTSGFMVELPQSSTDAGGHYTWAINGQGQIITPYQDGVYP